MKKSPTWSIVVTCSEPRVVIERFIAHHLSLDVEEIFLFFDNPTDLMAARLKSMPRVRVFSCDDTYWRARKHGRPADHRERQIYNANYAARILNKSDWIVSIDADEYLYSPEGRSFCSILGEVPSEVDAVRVLPAEHVFTHEPSEGSIHSDGFFKLKSKNRKFISDLIFGEFSSIFPSGFLGHEVGKSFKRSSAAGAVFNIHFVRINGANVPAHTVEQKTAVLLHSFPSSFEDFKKKFERRLASSSYMDGLSEKARERFTLYGSTKSASGEGGIRSFFRDVCLLSQSKLDALNAESLLLHVDLKFDDKVSAYVSPHLKRAPFLHLSEPSSAKVPQDQRIFQIGMNRSGSREICAELGRAGFSYCHWDEGLLARELRRAKGEGRSPFEEYSNYNVIGDINSSGPDLVYDGFLDFDYIFKFFPKSLFILNYRPVDDWIRSRSSFRKGRYLHEARKFFGFTSDDEVKKHWVSQWTNHCKAVRKRSRSDGLRLVEFPIYSMSPGSLIQEIRSIQNGGMNA